MLVQGNWSNGCLWIPQYMSPNNWNENPDEEKHVNQNTEIISGYLDFHLTSIKSNVISLFSSIVQCKASNLAQSWFRQSFLFSFLLLTNIFRFFIEHFLEIEIASLSTKKANGYFYPFFFFWFVISFHGKLFVFWEKKLIKNFDSQWQRKKDQIPLNEGKYWWHTSLLTYFFFNIKGSFINIEIWFATVLSTIFWLKDFNLNFLSFKYNQEMYTFDGIELYSVFRDFARVFWCLNPRNIHYSSKS